MEDAGKIAAVNRAQAVIEFKMDGTILTANENFLNAMSYSLAEIKGQHHSMFIEPNEKNSAAIVGLLAADRLRGDVGSPRPWRSRARPRRSRPPASRPPTARRSG
jgi:methyl-accepting chemotaxis protein